VAERVSPAFGRLPARAVIDPTTLGTLTAEAGANSRSVRRLPAAAGMKRSMSRNKEPKRIDVLGVDRKVIDATPKYFPDGALVLGTPYTAASLAALFQAEIDALKAIDAVRNQLHQMVADSLVLRRVMRKIRDALKNLILAKYGSNAARVLGAFGFPVPKKPGPKTTKAKAEGVRKGLATKKAKRDALAKLKKR
jgi:hypothetical protein